MTLFSQYKNTILRIALLFLFFAVLFSVVELFDLKDNFSLKKLQSVIDNNSLTGFIIFVVLFVIGNFIQIPGLVFLAAAVITLGKTTGGFVTYAAAVISCLISFLSIRLVGGNLLRKLPYKWANRVFLELDNNPIRSVFILRSVFQTLPLLNYGLALSGVSFRNHIIATIAALPLPIFLYCLFFEQLAKIAGIL